MLVILHFWCIISIKPFATNLLDQIGINFTYSMNEEQDPPIYLGNIIHDLRLDKVLSLKQLEENTLTFFPWSQASSKFYMIYKDSANSQKLVLQKKVDREKLCQFQHTLSKSKIFSSGCICNMENDNKICFMLISLSLLEFQEGMIIVTIRVIVNDINDNPPIFQLPNFTIMIKEEQAPSDWNYQSIPIAIDQDIELNAKILYRLTNHKDKFTIKYIQIANELKIAPLQTLDREKKDKYLIIIEAIDCGKPDSLSGSLNLTVNIIDINDSQPRFSKESLNLISVFISEQAKIGQKIATIFAHDNDIGNNSKLQFSLNEKLTDSYAMEHFFINKSTGAIHVWNELDREIYESVHLFVIVSDCGSPPRSNSMALTVIINDENDNAPFIECPENFIIEENRGELSTVGFIKAFDMDSGASSNCSCDLINIKPTNSFKLSNVTLESTTYIKKSIVFTFELSTTSILDRENISTYSLVILCHDNGSPRLSNSKLISILVSDQNDNIPFFHRSNFEIQVVENKVNLSSVLKLKASDNDIGINADLLYFIITNVDHTFMINQTSGDLYQIEPIDFERHKQITITIGCKDQGSPSFTTTAYVHVTIKDMNDVPPSLVSYSMNPSVAEHMPKGTVVQTLSVIDPDTGPGGEVSVALLPWENKFVFRNLNLLTNLEFDREINDKYSILVILRDNGQPRLTNSILLTITISDINDNRPRLTHLIGSPGVKISNQTISFSYQEPIGFSIATIYFHDDDINQNAQLTYFIHESEKPYFILHPDSGNLKLNSTCSVSDLGSFRLVIKVQDNGTPRLFSLLELIIHVVDGPSSNPDYAIITNFRIVLIVIPTLIGISFSVILLFVIKTVQKQKANRLINHNTKQIYTKKATTNPLKFKFEKNENSINKNDPVNDEALMELYPTSSCYSTYPSETCIGYSSFLPCMDSHTMIFQPGYVLTIDTSMIGSGSKLNILDTSTDSGNGDSSETNLQENHGCNLSNVTFKPAGVKKFSDRLSPFNK